MADHENCMWMSAIFERSSSVRVCYADYKEGRTISLEVLQSYVLSKNMPNRFEINALMRHFANHDVCHMTLDTRPSLEVAGLKFSIMDSRFWTLEFLSCSRL